MEYYLQNYIKIVNQRTQYEWLPNNIMANNIVSYKDSANNTTSANSYHIINRGNIFELSHI
jgi:hypothetical protein